METKSRESASQKKKGVVVTIRLVSKKREQRALYFQEISRMKKTEKRLQTAQSDGKREGKTKRGKKTETLVWGEDRGEIANPEPGFLQMRAQKHDNTREFVGELSLKTSQGENINCKSGCPIEKWGNWCGVDPTPVSVPLQKEGEKLIQRPLGRDGSDEPWVERPRDKGGKKDKNPAKRTVQSGHAPLPDNERGRKGRERRGQGSGAKLQKTPSCVSAEWEKTKNGRCRREEKKKETSMLCVSSYAKYLPVLKERGERQN